MCGQVINEVKAEVRVLHSIDPEQRDPRGNVQTRASTNFRGRSFTTSTI